jgi:PPM family protein phosphatase
MSTLTSEVPEIRVGTASRKGAKGDVPKDHNMDAYAVVHGANGVTAAAVVDGIGDDENGAAVMRLAAQVAARYGVTKGGLGGVMAAAGLIEDPGIDDNPPDGVLVLALVEPGRDTVISWVGDSHAYGWDGETLNLRSDPHTMGRFLRQNGDVDLAVHHDNWIRVSLSTATVHTVALSEIPASETVVLLLSDGLDTLSREELARLVCEHPTEPQALAEAIVSSARPDDEGIRDDATAVVIAVLPPIA